MDNIKAKISRYYTSVFSISEFEGNKTLIWIVWALIFTIFITIERWFREGVFTRSSTILERPNEGYLCWPHWTNCSDYYFFDLFPVSYTGNIFFVGLLCLIFLSYKFLYKKEYTKLHLMLLLLFCIKFFWVFFLSYKTAWNYDYYDLAFLFVVLFLSHKVFFLRLVFVLLYFIAAPLKFDESWILAKYFSTLKLGLPLFPESLAPLFTNFVIFLQIIGTWLLLSSKNRIQSVAYLFFLLFHVYSWFLVGFRYLLTTIPILHLLFSEGNLPKFAFPKEKKVVFWILFVLSLFVSQVWVMTWFSADRKLTLEGNRYSLYMFEANHQCVTNIAFRDPDGKEWTFSHSSHQAMRRCSPYTVWFFIANQCKKYNNTIQVRWTYDHSVNGSPFYRIVDQNDSCKLDYKAFSRNEWIRDERLPEYIIGYPVKNDL